MNYLASEHSTNIESIQENSRNTKPRIATTKRKKIYLRQKISKTQIYPPFFQYQDSLHTPPLWPPLFTCILHPTHIHRDWCAHELVWYYNWIMNCDNCWNYLQPNWVDSYPFVRVAKSPQLNGLCLWVINSLLFEWTFYFTPLASYEIPLTKKAMNFE